MSAAPDSMITMQAAVETACQAHAAKHVASLLRAEAERSLRPGESWRAPAFRDADRKYRAALAAYDEAVSVARALFAHSRGWIVAQTWFDVRRLGRAPDCRGLDFGRVIDHAECFRFPVRPWLPAAVVSHTYVPVAQAAKYAEAHGLAFEALDFPSWYYPGGTSAVLFTRRSNVVRFQSRRVRT